MTFPFKSFKPIRSNDVSLSKDEVLQELVWALEDNGVYLPDFSIKYYEEGKIGDCFSSVIYDIIDQANKNRYF